MEWRASDYLTNEAWDSDFVRLPTADFFLFGQLEAILGFLGPALASYDMPVRGLSS